jgi:L-seryl-tRNA(Ser) seleniumtransferase
VAPGAGGADALATALRRGEPPVVARVTEGRVLLDLRTVFAEQDEQLLHRLLPHHL